MKWIILNTLGAFAWLLGLLYTKQGYVAGHVLLARDLDHPALGLALCMVGLVVLVRTNMAA